MEIKVRDKTFKINFVNNYVHNQYEILVGLIAEIATMPDLFKELLEDFRDDEERTKDRVKLREIRATYKEEITAVDQKTKDLKKEISLIREDIVRELLEKNNYEYDYKWWLHDASRDDMNDFMIKSIKKDYKDSMSKKK